MSDFEIPFTRNDLLRQLCGEGKKLREFFLQACEGQLKTVENLNGDVFAAMDLLHAMANLPTYKESCFAVPYYLYEAWAAATKDSFSREHGVLFMGVPIRPWNREFIVAKVYEAQYMGAA